MSAVRLLVGRSVGFLEARSGPWLRVGFEFS